MTTNLNIKGINLAALSAKDRLKLEAKLSEIMHRPITLTADDTKTSNMGVLTDRLDIHGNYTCAHCNTVVNFNDLSDEDQAYAKKYAVCPECIKKIKIAEAIQAITPKRTVIREGDSAATIAKNCIQLHKSEITEAIMQLLTDKEYCRKNMKIRYPLFIEIPANASADIIKEMSFDLTGKRRFAAIKYIFPQIPNKQYLMTNDLYKNRIDKLVATIEKLIETNNETNNAVE